MTQHLGRRGTIVLAGSLAQRPGHGGHAWVFLQYLLGFQALGWDVLFLDELQESMCVDECGRPTSFEDSWNVRYFVDVMRRHGLEDAYALNCREGGKSVGLPRDAVLERVRRSTFLLNVMGFLSDHDLLEAAPRRVFLDIDPGFGQMWRDLGLADIFAGHDDFVTIGQNIGSPQCEVPTCGLRWLTTTQPIVLKHWPPAPPAPEGAFTSIASWRGPFGPIEYHGKKYGLRVHEFRRFLELPQLTGARFELAMDIHPAERADLDLLHAGGWQMINPRETAGTPQKYQQYIHASRAEFMVAKNLYVQTHGGWFSDRSICYLASGRPVLAQDTCITHLLPTGEGLLTFSNPQEAAIGVEAINRDYIRHARAARNLAEQYFDSGKVLTRLLQQLAVI